MVKIGLQVKATLEHIEELYTCHPKFNFCFKIRCLGCGEESEKWHDISESDNFSHTAQSKHMNNYIAKCKLCGRENSLDIIKNSNGKLTKDDEGKFKTIVNLDCRGIEPTDFQPSIGWIAKVDGSSRLFQDIDLSDKEWVEYDDKIKESVGVYDFQHQFIKIK